MSIFEIDPDIRRAHTLSSEFYTSEKYFELAKEKIFARTWHLVGTTDEAAHLKPFSILDTPLLLSKKRSGGQLFFQCLHSSRCGSGGKGLCCERDSLPVSRTPVRSERQVPLDAGIRWGREFPFGKGQLTESCVRDLGKIYLCGP